MNESFTKTLKTFVAVIVTVILVAFVCDVCREWFKLKPYNQAHLDIKTFDGTNSPYHPSVKYFENGWNGYKYWMAETPFYPFGLPYRDRNECPCIHVSNDGIHWSEVITNPLDDLDTTGVKELDYYSDPHLVMNGDTLECWYRINKRHGIKKDHGNVYLLCKKTTDGVRWTQHDTLFNFTNLQEHEMVSPAIIHDDTTYQMWYVDNEKLFFVQSTNPKDWKNPLTCQLKGYENCIPWHIDVMKDNGFYWLLVYDFKNDKLTLWKSSDRKEFNYVKTILDPSNAVGSFYQSSLYRSCMLKQSNNDYKIYFSAFNELCTYIGLMEGPSLDQLQVVNIDDKNNSNFAQFLKNYFQTRWRTIDFHLRHFRD